MRDETFILRWSKKSVGQCKTNGKRKFQEYCRYRDREQPCISCCKFITPEGMDFKWDGGHFYKAELYSSLMYHEHNCNKQCSYCNDHLAGNLIQYGENLENKIGTEAYNELKRLASIDKQVDPFDGTPAKLFHIEKYLHYKEKLRILEESS